RGLGGQLYAAGQPAGRLRLVRRRRGGQDEDDARGRAGAAEYRGASVFLVGRGRPDPEGPLGRPARGLLRELRVGAGARGGALRPLREAGSRERPDHAFLLGVV
ncbi:MAG: Alpha/beta hydrolase fold, partial [uncultured Rubrobacteraceae bacterium]